LQTCTKQINDHFCLLYLGNQANTSRRKIRFSFLTLRIFWHFLFGLFSLSPRQLKQYTPFCYR